MSGPVLAWEQLGLGFVRPLDEFTGRASAWHTIYTGFASQLWSCGGSDFHPDGSSAIASDTATEAARTLLDAVRAAGPAGLRRPNMWMWSMVMNARSDRPDAAWEFMEWASGSEFLTRTALAGNMNPTRRSTWADPGFAERASQWHGFPGVAMELVNDLADVLVTPAVNYIEVARRWTRALRDAYRDEGSLEQCLGAAAGDIDRLVIRA